MNIVHTIIPQGAVASIGREAGLIYAGVDEIYPVVAAYHRMNLDGLEFVKACRRLDQVLRNIASRFKYSDVQITCDNTLNPPELQQAAKLRARILIKPTTSIEVSGGVFTFGIGHIPGAAGNPGRDHLTVEYREVTR